MKETNSTSENLLGLNDRGATIGIYDTERPDYYQTPEGSTLGISVQHLVLYLFGEQPPLLSEAISTTIQKHLWLKEEFEQMEAVKNNLLDIEKHMGAGPSQECIDKILKAIKE